MRAASYPVPKDEEQRLRDLRRHGVLDTNHDENFERIVSLTAEVFDAPITMISLVDQQRQWFLASNGLNVTETPREVAFCAYTINQDKSLIVPDAKIDYRFRQNPLVTGSPYIRFYAGTPLKSTRGHNLGTLCIVDNKERELNEKEVRILELLAQLVIRELELRRKALICPLTEVFNRESFLQLAKIETQEAKDKGKGLSLLLFDIDNFGQINNRWGHEAGNRVLKEICSAVKSLLEESDLFGRVGDNEFAVLMLDREMESCLELSERIRVVLEEQKGVFDHSDYQPLMSGGLTNMSTTDNSFFEILKRSQDALDLAKGNGRNQVVRMLSQ